MSEDTEHPGFFPDEPAGAWQQDSFNELLIWCDQIGASDTFLYPGYPIWVEKDGLMHKVTERALDGLEIASLLDTITNDTGSSASVAGAAPLPFGYQVNVDRFKTLRYRGQAAACQDRWSTATSMVLRAIPGMPPAMEELGVEQAIVDAAYPRNGLVLFTGVMGQGKSTTLAAILRRMCEAQQRNIITLEAPIEFDYSPLPNKRSPVLQFEIPRHLPTFRAGVDMVATRYAAKVILVGESRDPETLKTMIASAEIGAAVYSTVHTQSVAATIPRIVNAFSQEEHSEVQAALVNAMRLIVQQRLLTNVRDGGRVAIREHLSFDADMRAELMKTDPREIATAVEAMVQQRGRSLLDAAREQHEAGVIDDETMNAIRFEREREAA